MKTNIPESDGRPTSEDLETSAAGKTSPKQPGRRRACNSFKPRYPHLNFMISSGRNQDIIYPFSAHAVFLYNSSWDVFAGKYDQITNRVSQMIGSTATRIPLQEQKWRSWRLFLARHVRMELCMLVRSLTSSISSTKAITSTYGEANSCP